MVETSKGAAITLNWMDKAACKGQDTELFFSDDKRTILYATEAYCNQCPVSQRCGLYAVETNSRYGLFSYTQEQRTNSRTRKKIKEAQEAECSADTPHTASPTSTP